ncbi:hypothetical protein [uncultured Tenacibaculum sp.]|uniref:hypothetical protein n=1 Tax=uncultured Tenacibaculum sp. TaxID=174713 RepID=UPI002632FBD7|nr:hypothetical protein [uncultured Tenacibaculum sp.]
MKIEKIDTIPNLNVSTKERVKLKFLKAEEPNRGEEIIYYSLYVDNIDYTEKIFGQNKIACSISNSTHIESEHNNKFVFIPYDNGTLISMDDLKTIKLKVFIKEKGRITYDSFRGNYFYSDKHVLINKRSIVITNMKSLESHKIRLDSSFDIEWVIFINSQVIRIVQRNNIEIIDYNIEQEKVIAKTSLPFSKGEFKRLFYRNQKDNITYLEASFIKNNEFSSEIIKLTH